MITEKSNRLQVIMNTDYDYPISDSNTLKMLKESGVFSNKYVGRLWLFCAIQTMVILRHPNASLIFYDVNYSI